MKRKNCKKNPKKEESVKYVCVFLFPLVVYVPSEPLSVLSL